MEKNIDYTKIFPQRLSPEDERDIMTYGIIQQSLLSEMYIRSISNNSASIISKLEEYNKLLYSEYTATVIANLAYIGLKCPIPYAKIALEMLSEYKEYCIFKKLIKQ